MVGFVLRSVEQDLETMWQVASHDNRKMAETLSRSTRRLNTADVTPAFNDDILLQCCDDERPA